MKRTAGALLLCLIGSGCSPVRPPATGPALENGGTVVVYLLTGPRDAARPALRLDDISAMREDGTVLPLSLRLNDPYVAGPSSERRLARQTLPPGHYTGLAVRLSTLARPDGQKANPPQQPEPIRVAVPFTIEKRRAVVLSLRLEARNPSDSGSAVTPAISCVVPQRPTPGLIGVASSRGSSEVTIFDKVSGRVTGVVPTGRAPIGLAVDPDRRRAYVAASLEDTIETIGLLEQDVLSRIALRGGDRPVELALTPDGRTLLSANEGSSTVSTIDALSLVETARIQVGNGPRSILIDRAGRRAYSFNADSGTLTVIDVTARSVVGTIATDAGPLRGQFNRAGDRLYVIHRSSPYLSVIDPLALAVSTRVYIGPGAVALKVDSQTDRIYVARREADALEIYDPLSFLPVDTIPTEGDVSYMTIDDEGNNLYLVLPRMNQVQVLRIVGKEPIARAEVGDEPSRVALSGER